MLAQVAASRRFRRLRSRLATLPGAQQELLAAVLAVEMSARPTAFRAVEWIVVCVGRALGLPRQMCPHTLGPFQLSNGPFRFDNAVRVAVDRIGEATETSTVAQIWNGPHPDLRRPGARYSYAEALTIAHMLVRRGARFTAAERDST